MERKTKVDFTSEEERLTKEFAGRVSAQQGVDCLEEMATSLGRGARISSYIPLLAEHATREHLRARLAR